MGKSRKKQETKAWSFSVWWLSLNSEERGTGVRLLVHVGLALFVAGGGVYALDHLEGYVESHGSSPPAVLLTLLGVPEAYRGRPAREVLAEAKAVVQAGWSDAKLTEKIGRAVANVGWVRRVKRVEKLYDGRVLIDCEYRTAMALVESGGEYFLVDSEGVRLPGEYANDMRYRLITGVRVAAPEPGQAWEGRDLRAGLAMLTLLRGEPFWKQISAVSVRNFRGRLDPRGSHIELVTTSPGPGRIAGRIRWGSALGQEIEEPTPEEKLATLGANYEQYSRIDCNKLWIDVSTQRGSFLYPDSTTAELPDE